MTTSALDMSAEQYRQARREISGVPGDRRYAPPAAPTPESALELAARNFGVLQPTVLQVADLAMVKAGPDLARSAATEVRRLREKYPAAFAADVRGLDQAAYQAQKRAMVKQ